MRRILANLGWSAVLALLLIPATAQADDKRAEAARAFAAGDQAYDAGQNLAAARAYENAYALYPLPGITFSIAQAYRRHYFEDSDVRWLENAQRLYKRYLEEEPSGPRRSHAITHLANIAVLMTEHARNDGTDGDEPAAALTELLISSIVPGATASIDGVPARPVPVVQKVTPGPHRVTVAAPGHFEVAQEVQALEGRLIIVPTDLKPRPGTLRVVADEHADVWVDGRLAGSAGGEITLDAGKHSIAVAAPGRRLVSRSVEVKRGDATSLNVELETSSQRKAAYGLFGGGAALTLFGGAMSIFAAVSETQATDARAGLAEGRAMTPEQARDSNEALERRDLARGLAIAGFGGGAVAGLSGTFVFVFDNPVPSSTSRDNASVFGVGVVGAF